jgi:hypothetical protein
VCNIVIQGHVSWGGQSTTSTNGALRTSRTRGLRRLWSGLLSLRTHGFVRLWGLTAYWDTLCRWDRVDILRYSAQRFTIYQITRIKTYSRQVYLFDQWIEIPFRGPNGGVEVDALGTCSLILIPLKDFPVVFLAFFWGVRLVVAFHLLARVFDTPTLAPMEGSSMA